MTALLITVLLCQDVDLQAWSKAECGADMVCKTGSDGERGPFQIGPAVWTGRRCQGDPWDWGDSARCAVGYLHNLEGRQLCGDRKRWALAAYQWGIGNVRRLQREYGCRLDLLPRHVAAYVYRIAGRPSGRMLRPCQIMAR